ncbi:DUF4238 domain-containing protein [Pantoea ananatis]|uniref:DUF4238 domain-containing protein n=1 Tax=Pantoea ananas TaxID=553 RepID=UPI001B314072|nr:DUF4238 domain-containing protein [Pantoea ananatis]
MAGKRHHYIPRFLQRGFLMGEPKKEYTYMYLNGGVQRRSKIDNVGVEGHFYSISGEAELDDIYTDLENTYSDIISKIKKFPLKKVDEVELAEIISHFEVRTNNLRRSFYSSSKDFLDKMTERFVSGDMLKSLIQNKIQQGVSNGGVFDDLFNQLSIPSQHREALFEHIRPMIEINIEGYINSISEPIKFFFKEAINERLKTTIKRGHINGMIRHVSKNAKLEDYKDLNYRVINTNFNLILSDSVVIFDFEGLNEFKPFYDIKNTLKSVYLPISSNLFIYGTKDNSEPKLDILNEMSAKCSSDFFIACDISSDFSSLQGLIGQNCALLTDAEMKQILEEVIAEQMSQLYP